MKVAGLFITLLGLAGVQGADVTTHCQTACRSLVDPRDPVEKKAMAKVLSGECTSAFKKSSRDGKLCMSMIQKSAKVACELGCTKLINGNVLANSMEVGVLRNECKSLSGGMQGPYAKQSCETGFKAGLAFAVEGIKKRVQIDEICAQQDNDEPQQQQPPPKEVVPPKAKEVKEAAPPQHQQQVEQQVEEPAQAEDGLSIEEIQFSDDVASSNDEEPRGLRTMEV